MKAVNYFIIIDKVKTNQEKSGLFISDELDIDNKYHKGKILSIGNLVEGVNEGDTVYYKKSVGHGIQYKDDLYYVIRVSDVVLIE
jgi:co-chaperonin GroES (HSP10)